MDIRQAIRSALPNLETMANLGFVEGTERVVMTTAVEKSNPGISHRLASDIADFLPIAFGRWVLRDNPLRFDEHYLRIDSAGRARVYCRLDDEPAYREAVAIIPEAAAMDLGAIASLITRDAEARDILQADAQRAGENVVKKLARASAEYQMIDAALRRGSRPENLDLSPPIINGPDEFCDPLDRAPAFAEKPWWWETWKPQAKPRPWWKFW